jgi:hypothetical protein
MKPLETSFEPWNAMSFTLLGAGFGAIYGLVMGGLVGVLSISTIDLLIWGLMSTASLGAVLAGGIAVIRNYVAFCIVQSRDALTPPLTIAIRERIEKSPPGVIRAG